MLTDDVTVSFTVVVDDPLPHPELSKLTVTVLLPDINHLRVTVLSLEPIPPDVMV